MVRPLRAHIGQLRRIGWHIAANKSQCAASRIITSGDAIGATRRHADFGTIFAITLVKYRLVRGDQAVAFKRAKIVRVHRVSGAILEWDDHGDLGSVFEHAKQPNRNETVFLGPCRIAAVGHLVGAAVGHQFHAIRNGSLERCRDRGGVEQLHRAADAHLQICAGAVDE